MLGKLVQPGDDNAGRRQVAHQPLLGRRTMHDARAGVGQQGVGRDQPGRKLLDLLRRPVGRYPVKAIGRKLGREFPRQRAVQAAEAGPRGRFHELGKLPAGVGHRRAMDRLRP